MSRSRYFANPFPDFKEQFGVSQRSFVNTERVKVQLREVARQCLTRNDFDSDGGLYVGAGGAAYLYLHIRKSLSPAEDEEMRPLAMKLLQDNLDYYERTLGSSSKGTQRVQFLLGAAGIYAVGAVFGHVVNNLKLKAHCLENYINAANICKPVHFFKSGGDEIFVGRAGYLLGALWLEENLGCQPVPREDLRNIWISIIESGRTYSKDHGSPCPLMYAYYKTEYLGAAHGLCAILQVLLSFPDFLRDCAGAEGDVRASIDYYLSLQGRDGNFPCALNDSGRGARTEEDQLVHWCHGAPGAVYMFAKAHLVFKDHKYLEACFRCADLVWHKGLLKKGPGICHGVAGNGYVFLLLHRLVKETAVGGKYLWRAARFCEFMNTHEFQTKARTPDSPFSLYEGLAGTACFFNDLIHSESASFPFFNVFFSSTASN